MKTIKQPGGTWFKILDNRGRSVHGEEIEWTFAVGDAEGIWIDAPGPGAILTSNPSSQLKQGYRIFAVEIEGPVRIKNDTTALASRVRLIREVEWFTIRPTRIDEFTVFAN